MTILNSATRIVFILMAIAVIILTFLGIIDSKDFMILANGVFAYYYTRKQNETNTELK